MATEMNQAKAEAFAGQVIETLNHTSVGFLMSVGHRTGLMDAMAELGPAECQEISDASGLQERYVREWLGGMTTGRIVEYDPATRKYMLPAEHAAFLTRAAGPDNLAGYAETLLVLAQVEDKLVEVFRNGGGVPYSDFPRFQTVMAALSGPVHDAALIDGILPMVPGLPDRLSQGIRVADVGCGQGHAINLMAKAFPSSQFVGYDFSNGGIAVGRHEAREWGLGNVEFIAQDVTNLNVHGEFQLVTAFDSIHDQAKPASVLAGISEAISPDGVFLMVDEDGSSELQNNMDMPIAPILYTISTFHCMTVSLAQGGDGLGTMWGREKALEMLGEAGFGNVTVSQMEGDIENVYYIAKKS